MIGKIYWSVFPFYDSKNSRNAFKKRPVLIISGPRNNDYTVLPISSVTKKQNLDSQYDFELDINKYPLLNLNKTCYLRTHKQTIVHQASLTTMICDFKTVYPDLFIETMTLFEQFEKEVLDNSIK